MCYLEATCLAVNQFLELTSSQLELSVTEFVLRFHRNATSENIVDQLFCESMDCLFPT